LKDNISTNQSEKERKMLTKNGKRLKNWSWLSSYQNIWILFLVSKAAM